MKIRKVLATVLCAAVTLTSLSMDVSAAAIDVLSDGEVLLQEDQVSIEQEKDISAPDGDNNTLVPKSEISADNEILVEDSVLSEDSVISVDKEASAEVMDKDNKSDLEQTEIKVTDLDSAPPIVEAEKERKVTPFRTDTETLTLSSEYDSLKDDWGLDSVVIPAMVKHIPASEALFQNNDKIKTITFENPNNIVEIDEKAFLNSAITQFTMPSGLTEIKNNTFEGCTGLERIVLKNVTVIGDAAFKGCTGITSSGISGGVYVEKIGNNAFENTGFTTLYFGGMTQKEITVGEAAFANCVSMTKAVLPAGFKAVPKECFKGCKRLENVEFGKAEYIGEKAFDGCNAIQKIDLPATVADIADGAFSKCDNLKELYIRYRDRNTGYADYMTIGSDIVYYPKQLTLYGYEGDVKRYANAHSIKYISLVSDFEVKVGESAKGVLSSYKFSKVGSETKGKPIKAMPGETVAITVTASSPWVITKIYDIKDPENVEIPFTFAAGDQNTQMFSFVMPERSVEIGVKTIVKDIISKGTISYELTGYDYKYDEIYDSDKKLIGYKTPTTGNKAQLQVYATCNKTKYALGAWSSKYKSDKTNIVSITGSGVMTAVGKGFTDISFTTYGKTSKFKVYVIDEAEIGSLEFDQSRLEQDFSDAPYGTVGTVTRKFTENGETVERTVPKISYYKSDLSNSNLSFDLHLIIYDKKGAEVNANAAWTIDDKEMASTANSSNCDNINRITVKKGCGGETYIKASVTTEEVDNHNRKIVKYAYAVLQVIDPAPRTTANLYMVNKQCNYVAVEGEGVEEKNSDGTIVEIIATEGYDINPELMVPLLYKDTAVNSADPFYGIGVTYVGKSKDHDRGYLYRLTVIDGDAQVNTLGENKSIEYSDKTQLYLRGVFAETNVNDGLNNKIFYIPISRLVIFNQKPKPTVKQSGQINIFYNSKCYEPENNDWAGWEEILGNKAVKDQYDSTFPANRTKFINNTIGEISVTQSYAKTNAEVDYDGVYNEEDRKNNQEIGDYIDDIAGGESKAVRTRLISEKNYAYFVNPNKHDSRETKDGVYFDSFANNFTVTASENGKDFVIRRSENEMAQINGQDITSGYLLIYYKGYKDPVAYKLKLNTKNQAPAYVISPSNGTDNCRNYKSGTANNVMFEIGLFNKKTSKSVLYDDDDMEVGYPRVDLTASTRLRDCVYNEDVAIEKYHDLSKNINVMNIVKNQNYGGKSTAVIVVKKNWWDKEQSYKLTVNESDKLPTGKLKSSKLELNNWLVGPESTTTYKVNQGPCTVSVKNDDIIPLPTRKQSKDDFDKLTLSAESAGDGSSELIIKAEINENSIPKGSYKFKFTPVAEFIKSGVELKEVTFTVNVVSKQPTVKLSNKNYNFNIDYPFVETYKVNATFGSIPKTIKPEDYDLDKTSAHLEPTAKVGTDAYNVAQDVAGCFEITKFEYNPKTKKVDFFCKLKDGHGYTSFNCKYKLEGLKLCKATLKPVNITIKSNHGIPSIILSGSGKINTLDKWSYYTVKPTVKNLVNPDITDISCVEYDSSVRKYITNDRFSITRESNPDKDTTLAYIRATHNKDSKGKDTCTNTDHRLILKYRIGADVLESAEFKLRPVQTAPKLTATPSSAVFYNNADPENSVATVELKKTSVLNASVDKTAKNKGIKLSESNSLELRNAFTVTYSDEGAEDVPAAAGATESKAGKVVIRCVAPELLTKGTTYNLVLEPEWKGQFADSTGSTVTVKVRVQ